MPSAQAHSRRDVMEGLPRPSSEGDTPAPLPDERTKLPRPTDDVGEPAHKINRSEIAAVNKFAVRAAVAAAFLHGFDGAHFEGNRPAEEALEEFLDAFGNRVVKSTWLDRKAWTVIECLGGRNMEPDKVDVIIEAAIDAATGVNRTSESKRAIRAAVAAAFLDGFDGAQFEGNLRAEEALERFVDACAQTPNDSTTLDRKAWTVIDRLEGHVESDKVDVIIAAAIEAGTGIRRTCLFDGPSIDFPLGNGEKVKVLVRKDTTFTSRDSPLFRHTAVAAFQADGAIKIAGEISGRFNPLALISGAPGSGKTMCGISVVAYLRGCHTASACLRLRCGADWFTFSPGQEPCVPLKTLPLLACRNPKLVFDLHAFEETYKSAHGARVERNLVAQHFVLQTIDKVITWHHRKEPTKEGVLVVFLDEAEDYPTFVRAMCGCFDKLQDVISDRYSSGACKVRVVMAGTGIEGEDQRVGSEHTSIFPYHLRPRVG
jgi:hypothetical protein